ncbi:MFS drug efflux transporter [Geopyxis carbonaria]|nr:MFS drug efflux transporter [Geopyxis carbonaria]
MSPSEDQQSRRTTPLDSAADSLQEEKKTIAGGKEQSDTSLELGGTPEPDSQAPPRKVKGILWVLVVTAILSSHFLFALDNTIVANIQPAIIEQFSSVDKLSWVSVGFALSSCGLVLPFSKFYGIFNARWLYLSGMGLFMVGSALCGAAPTMNALIIGRVIAGGGGAGMYLGVLTLLSVSTTVQERPSYIGLTAISWGLGTVTGPAIGGGFAESAATWRWAFYINLVVGGVFSPIYLLLLPSHDPQPGVPMRKRIGQIDFLGTFLILGFITFLIMGIDFGGLSWAWNSGEIISFFVISAVFFIAFGAQQKWMVLTTKELRLFPTHFLKRRSLVLLFILNCCSSSGLFISVYYIPLYFQFTRNDTAVDAAVRLLPFVLILIFVIVLNGHMMSRFGYYSPWYLVGGILELIGSVLMYMVDANTSTAKIYGYTIMLAAGVGAFNQAGYSVAQAKVLPSEIPYAVGFMAVSQLGGIVIGLGCAGCIFLNLAQKGLEELLPTVDTETIQSAITGTGSTLISSLSAEVRDKAIGIISDSIGNVYLLAVAAGAITTLGAVFLKHENIFIENAGAG